MWITVCGVREASNAVAMARLGIDAVGLNFYTQSPRHVSVDTARQIVQELRGACLTVGLFVNHSAEQIAEIVDATDVDLIQLHGDESAEFVGQITERPVILAQRMGSGSDSAAVGEFFRQAALGEADIFAGLVDAAHAGTYGGSGHTAPWQQLSPEQRIGWPQLILAGGLKPQNVAAAIAAVRPFGVDVASGVELAPGIKDLALVRQLVEQCRLAEQQA